MEGDVSVRVLGSEKERLFNKEYEINEKESASTQQPNCACYRIFSFQQYPSTYVCLKDINIAKVSRKHILKSCWRGQTHAAEKVFEISEGVGISTKEGRLCITAATEKGWKHGHETRRKQAVRRTTCTKGIDSHTAQGLGYGAYARVRHDFRKKQKEGKIKALMRVDVSTS